MALETLKDVTQVNGHEVHRVEWNQPSDHHIEINDKHNSITFKIQDGPIKENGHNGCQVDEIISTALLIIKGLNKKFPSDYNASAITHLYGAYTALQQRKLDREIRGVEGESKI